MAELLAPLMPWAPLPLRLLLGLVYFTHGWPKVGPNWRAGGPAVARHGIPLPLAASVFIGILEVGGGALLIAGLYTREFALLLAAAMVVAAWRGKRGLGFVNGADFPLTLAAGSVTLALTGAGAWALDGWLGR